MVFLGTTTGFDTYMTPTKNVAHEFGNNINFNRVGKQVYALIVYTKTLYVLEVCVL